MSAMRPRAAATVRKGALGVGAPSFLGRQAARQGHLIPIAKQRLDFAHRVFDDAGFIEARRDGATAGDI
jgi:hypothetical protein